MKAKNLTRLEKLEEKALPEKEQIIVITGMDGPGECRVKSEVFDSMEAVRAKYSDADFTNLRVVYDDTGGDRA